MTGLNMKVAVVYTVVSLLGACTCCHALPLEADRRLGPASLIRSAIDCECPMPSCLVMPRRCLLLGLCSKCKPPHYGKRVPSHTSLKS